MIRHTDRDCYAALIRVAAALNSSDSKPECTWLVEAPYIKGEARKAMHKLAESLDVRLVAWNDESQNDRTRRLVLDHAPRAYGVGVRPSYCEGLGTGQWTPDWWLPSAGLGPGAVPRKTFCYILGAVERALSA